jgi:hypothetical protein
MSGLFRLTIKGNFSNKRLGEDIWGGRRLPVLFLTPFPWAPGNHAGGLPDPPSRSTWSFIIAEKAWPKFFLKLFLGMFEKKHRWLMKPVTKLNPVTEISRSRHEEEEEHRGGH